jgi:AAA domain
VQGRALEEDAAMWDLNLGPIIPLATMPYRRRMSVGDAVKWIIDHLDVPRQRKRAADVPFTEKAVRLNLQLRAKPQAETLCSFLRLNRKLEDWPVDYELMVLEYEVSRHYEELYEALRSGTPCCADGFIVYCHHILEMKGETWAHRWVRERIRFFKLASVMRKMRGAHLIIVCGVPGAGKSTFALHAVKRWDAISFASETFAETLGAVARGPSGDLTAEAIAYAYSAMGAAVENALSRDRLIVAVGSFRSEAQRSRFRRDREKLQRERDDLASRLPR